MECEINEMKWKWNMYPIKVMLGMRLQANISVHQFWNKGCMQFYFGIWFMYSTLDMSFNKWTSNTNEIKNTLRSWKMVKVVTLSHDSAWNWKQKFTVPSEWVTWDTVLCFF
jgi:hypothetical protein